MQMQPTGMRYRLVIEARYKPNTALLGVLDAVRTSAEIKVGIETGRPHVKIQGSEEHGEKDRPMNGSGKAISIDACHEKRAHADDLRSHFNDSKKLSTRHTAIIINAHKYA
jgi:hypothetical protein